MSRDRRVQASIIGRWPGGRARDYDAILVPTTPTLQQAFQTALGAAVTVARRPDWDDEFSRAWAVHLPRGIAPMKLHLVMAAVLRRLHARSPVRPPTIYVSVHEPPCGSTRRGQPRTAGQPAPAGPGPP